MFIVELGGVYEFRRRSAAAGTAIDGLLAFRYWNMSVDASVQWVDPVLGVRLRHQFTPHQSIFVRGDIGGFGLGGSWLTSERAPSENGLQFDCASVARYLPAGRYAESAQIPKLTLGDSRLRLL